MLNYIVTVISVVIKKRGRPEESGGGAGGGKASKYPIVGMLHIFLKDVLKDVEGDSAKLVPRLPPEN